MTANGPVLTTQLYFPGEPGNRRDPLHRRELELRIVEEGTGRFDFVPGRGCILLIFLWIEPCLALAACAHQGMARPLPGDER